MIEKDSKIKFFLGANTSRGFCSFFDQLQCNDNWQTYVLKGGPGTGKSSGLKRIARESGNELTEYIYCSADPNSLDAVILHNKGVSIADGTSPHDDVSCILEAYY